MFHDGITRTSGCTDFSYIGPSTPFDIVAGDSRDITIQFSSSSTGSKNATFNVNSNDPDEPDVTFDTSGDAMVIPADANIDGIVDVSDLVIVKRIILGEDPPTPGADANLDAAIDVFDLVRIKRIILGIDPQDNNSEASAV